MCVCIYVCMCICMYVYVCFKQWPTAAIECRCLRPDLEIEVHEMSRHVGRVNAHFILAALCNATQSCPTNRA